MPPFPDLAQRVREPEDIDDPALDTDGLHGALKGLERINFVSASTRIVWPAITRLANHLGTDRLRVLDIATGAGDIPIALWKKASHAGLRLEILGTDISDRALEFARRRADARGASVSFNRLDALADELPRGFDVVMSSLFLHHLDEERARQLLSTMAVAAGHLVLINDLRRNTPGLLLAHLAGQFLTRSPVVRVDAVRSVRAAFSLAEIRTLANAAGLETATIGRRWPCRFLLHWSRPAV